MFAWLRSNVSGVFKAPGVLPVLEGPLSKAGLGGGGEWGGGVGGGGKSDKS